MAGALESLKQTRESLVGQLLVQDSPAIWSDTFRTRARVDTAHDRNGSLAAQIGTLSDFAETMLRYVILLLGFFFAVAAVGFDLTKFAILAGAFGVGIGFGLQNIINNFVSGLILLFERPVKVDDLVKVADAIGTVRRIGIRASLVQRWDDAEIIVPNSKLIAESVTNRTFSTQRRGIEIPVGAAYGTDPKQVIELLSAKIAEHPPVADEPAPKVFFVEFGADSLNFKARARTTHGDKRFGIRSDPAVAGNEVLTAEKISIPSGQNDVHIAGISEDAAQALENNLAESLKSAEEE